MPMNSQLVLNYQKKSTWFDKHKIKKIINLFKSFFLKKIKKLNIIQQYVE